MRHSEVSRAIALALFSVHPLSLLAQGVATNNQLAPIVVIGTRAPLDPNLPATTASKTAEQLREQNIFNPEDALNLLPGISVRKRYLGDRNATVGGRTHGVLQPGRSLVYLDGYLISNFLGRFDAPRWNMVSPEALSRVDALYGPFSAIFPGNSMGSTVVMTERVPKGFEASASIKLNRQSFSEYQTRDHYGSSVISARIAGLSDTGLWWAIATHHQDSTGHPMGYANAVRGAAGQFGAPNLGVRVSGISRDLDPLSIDRALFGATTIDRSQQSTLNLRAGYAISREQSLELRLSSWTSKSTVTNDTDLRDAQGNRVWSGIVNDGVHSFAVAANAFAPSRRDESHRQLGLTWKTRNASGWNASVVASTYKVLSDVNRQANAAQPLADLGSAGVATRRDGTGWHTLEVQGTYTPSAHDWGRGQHRLTVGAHQNRYQLINAVRDARDWRSTEGNLSQIYEGRTTVQALYAQDAWTFMPDWMLTTGIRSERFEATDGSQFFAGPPPAQTAYATRTLSTSSPKLSVSYAGLPDWFLRASAGKGVRFPNVDELFNGVKTGTSIAKSDPQLRPEVVTAWELSAQRDLGQHSMRVSLFKEDATDTILRQSDITVTPVVTRVSNVDRVVSRGAEAVVTLKNVATQGLDIDLSGVWVRSIVNANAANPAQVGKRWLRIAPQRYTVQASYRVNDAWLFAANYRWTGRMYNTELNIDTRPDVFGGTSRVRQLDIRSAWRVMKQWELSAGINNLTNSTSWQAHTLPQRNLQLELKYANF